MRIGSQIDHRAARLHAFAVFRAQHRAPTGGEYDSAALGEFVDGLGFALTEAILAFVLEDDRNAHARARFNLMVGVIELPPKTSCHCAPNRGLARPHQSDKYYVFQHKSLIFGFQPPMIPGYASGVRNASTRRAPR